MRLNATTVELELISVQQLSGVPYLGENFNDRKPVNRLPHTKKMSIVKCTLALLLDISTHLNAYMTESALSIAMHYVRTHFAIL